jgi:hypothetical protein
MLSHRALLGHRALCSGGARYLPHGGVVRIMELVEHGYVYIRP